METKNSYSKDAIEALVKAHLRNSPLFSEVLESDLPIAVIATKVREQIGRLEALGGPQSSASIPLDKRVQDAVRRYIIEDFQNSAYRRYQELMRSMEVRPLSAKDFTRSKEGGFSISVMDNFIYIERQRISKGDIVIHNSTKNRFKVLGFTPHCWMQLEDMVTGEKKTLEMLKVYIREE